MIKITAAYYRNTKAYHAVVETTDHVAGYESNTFLADNTWMAIGYLTAKHDIGPQHKGVRIAMLNALYESVGSDSRCFMRDDGFLKIQMYDGVEVQK